MAFCRAHRITPVLVFPPSERGLSFIIHRLHLMCICTVLEVVEPNEKDLKQQQHPFCVHVCVRIIVIKLDVDVNVRECAAWRVSSRA